MQQGLISISSWKNAVFRAFHLIWWLKTRGHKLWLIENQHPRTEDNINNKGVGPRIFEMAPRKVKLWKLSFSVFKVIKTMIERNKIDNFTKLRILKYWNEFFVSLWTTKHNTILGLDFRQVISVQKCLKSWAAYRSFFLLAEKNYHKQGPADDNYLWNVLRNVWPGQHRYRYSWESKH